MKKRIAGIIAVATIALALLGCPEKKGPLEKAGKKIDKAAEDVKDGLKDAADELKE